MINASRAYSFDASNRLVRRVDDVQQTVWPNYAGSDTIFTYENGQIVLAFEVLGTQTQRFVWGPNTDQLLATEYTPGYYGGGHIYFPLADAQGTIHDAAKFFLADAQTQTYVTQVVMHRFIDAYGRDLDMDLFTGHHFGAGVTLQDYSGPLFLFTGRYTDSLTGLQNNWNRWYAPDLGRWMTEDPIGFQAGDSNLYRYVGNNPVTRTDPTGLADKITAKACREACDVVYADDHRFREICKKLVCGALKNATCTGLKSLCGHLLRHGQKQAAEACLGALVHLCPGVVKCEQIDRRPKV